MPATASVWPGALQRLVNRAAHEVRNSLNGVAVNLEVVRTRSAREGTPAAAVALFATSAAEQFERLTRQVEAVLALSRPPVEPLDVARVLQQLVDLLAGGGSGGDVSVVVSPECSGATTTSVAGDLARAVLADAVMSTLVVGHATSWSVRCAGGTVRCEVAAPAPVMLDARTHVAAGAAAIRWTDGAVDFPAA